MATLTRIMKEDCCFGNSDSPSYEPFCFSKYHKQCKKRGLNREILVKDERILWGTFKIAALLTHELDSSEKLRSSEELPLSSSEELPLPSSEELPLPSSEELRLKGLE